MNHASREDLVQMALRANQEWDSEKRPLIATGVTFARTELVGAWPILAEARSDVGDAPRRRYRRGGRRWWPRARGEHRSQSNRDEICDGHRGPPSRSIP